MVGRPHSERRVARNDELCADPSMDLTALICNWSYGTLAACGVLFSKVFFRQKVSVERLGDVRSCQGRNQHTHEEGVG